MFKDALTVPLGGDPADGSENALLTPRGISPGESKRDVPLKFSIGAL